MVSKTVPTIKEKRREKKRKTDADRNKQNHDPFKEDKPTITRMNHTISEQTLRTVFCYFFLLVHQLCFVFFFPCFLLDKKGMK